VELFSFFTSTGSCRVPAAASRSSEAASTSTFATPTDGSTTSSPATPRDGGVRRTARGVLRLAGRPVRGLDGRAGPAAQS